VPIVACRGPADCFEVAQVAWRIAVRYMTPVMILSDGYIANGSEPWLIPEVDALAKIEVRHPAAEDYGFTGNGGHAGGRPFLPYERDERLARPWAIPGTPGLMHRIGGLEKQDVTGNVNYEPENHEHMVHQRARKVANIARELPPQAVEGPESGKVLVLSWGGTYGACATAVEQCRAAGGAVAHAHLRYLNPLPADLGDILKRYERVLIPELNLGQLRLIIRGTYMVDAVGLNKVQGRPFHVSEVVAKINELLAT
jgi:2-oxoglutarate ferredoxin oxidoreductase subunit alpha